MIDAVPNQTTIPIYADEIVSIGSIPKDKIIGIICSGVMGDLTISELDLFAVTPLSDAVPTYTACINVLKNKGIDTRAISKEIFKLNVSEINTQEDLDYANKVIDNANKQITQRLQWLFDKELGKQNCTVMDVIQHYNTNNLPVYTNAEELIKEAYDNRSDKDIDDMCKRNSLRRPRMGECIIDRYNDPNYYWYPFIKGTWTPTGFETTLIRELPSPAQPANGVPSLSKLEL